MAKYLKTYSKYVKETTHQTAKDGKILERDWTTIGGTDTFTTTQPIAYRNNNFIITVSEPNAVTYDRESGSWFKNDNGDDTWSLGDVSSVTETYDSSSSPDIDNSYNDLRDYAYYGSCKELIRASINDIFKKFPGEIYITDEELHYFNGKVYTSFDYDYSILCMASNPFNVNLHGKLINLPDTDDNLRYFANNGYKEYEIIDDKGNATNIDEIMITDLPDECNFYYTDIHVGNPVDGQVHYTSAMTNSVTGTGNNFLSFTLEDIYFNEDFTEFTSIYDKNKFFNKGKVYTDTGKQYYGTALNGKYELPKVNYISYKVLKRIDLIIKETVSSRVFSIYLLASGNNFKNKFYAASSELTGYHIRPKNKIEKLSDGSLIDRRYYDNFISSLDRFQQILLNTKTDPIYKSKFDIIYQNDYGFYHKYETFVFPTNAGGYNLGNNSSFNLLLSKLTNISEFYDEYFSDNLYRMMTHETIKNFDWAYSRDNNGNEENDYLTGTTRIKNIIRIFGREFDELKLYVNKLANGRNVSYDKLKNIDYYFLSDLLNYNGWDIKNAFPFIKCSNGLFSQINNLTYTPYDEFTDESKKSALYNSKEPFSNDDINNRFLQCLQLNSREIIRHKGTIEGIEMILGLFGLRSKRWAKKYNDQHAYMRVIQGSSTLPSIRYDYDIKEYSTFMYPLFDDYDENKKICQYDYYNKAKLISYSEENYYNDIYDSYRGLPVTYQWNETSGKSFSGNILYPYFDKNGKYKYDGGLYYQMNGGWFNISPFDFTDDDIPISGSSLYSETSRKIVKVNNLYELLHFPYNELHNGEIAYVDRIEPNKIILEGEVFNIDNDEFGKPYVSLMVENKSLIFNNSVFSNIVYIMNSNGIINGIDLSLMNDGEEVRSYIVQEDGNDTLYLYNDVTSLENVTFTNDIITDTRYFILQDLNGYQEIGDFGWKPLQSNDEEYLNSKRIKNNFFGNNPHNGLKKYDNGFSYLKSYYKLFQYPFNNDLFDYTAFENDYNVLNDKISNFGFKRLEGSNDNDCDKTYFELEDEKIHSFVQKYDKSMNEINSIGILGSSTYSSFTNSDTIDSFSGVMNDSVYLDRLKGIACSEAFLKDYRTNEYQTCSIVNTKRIDILFKKEIFNNSTKLENAKFLLDVINNYLKQMLPLNIICNFNFDTL